MSFARSQRDTLRFAASPAATPSMAGGGVHGRGTAAAEKNERRGARESLAAAKELLKNPVLGSGTKARAKARHSRTHSADDLAATDSSADEDRSPAALARRMQSSPKAQRSGAARHQRLPSPASVAAAALSAAKNRMREGREGRSKSAGSNTSKDQNQVRAPRILDDGQQECSDSDALLISSIQRLLSQQEGKKRSLETPDISAGVTSRRLGKNGGRGEEDEEEGHEIERLKQQIKTMERQHANEMREAHQLVLEAMTGDGKSKAAVDSLVPREPVPTTTPHLSVSERGPATPLAHQLPVLHTHTLSPSPPTAAANPAAAAAAAGQHACDNATCAQRRRGRLASLLICSPRTCLCFSDARHAARLLVHLTVCEKREEEQELLIHRVGKWRGPDGGVSPGQSARGRCHIASSDVQTPSPQACRQHWEGARGQDTAVRRRRGRSRSRRLSPHTRTTLRASPGRRRRRRPWSQACLRHPHHQRSPCSQVSCCTYPHRTLCTRWGRSVRRAGQARRCAAMPTCCRLPRPRPSPSPQSPCRKLWRESSWVWPTEASAWPPPTRGVRAPRTPMRAPRNHTARRVTSHRRRRQQQRLKASRWTTAG